MKKHLFSLNVRDTPSDRLKKFANFFLRDGKRERTEKIMRDLFIKIKEECKENPGEYILSRLDKLYVPLGLEKESQGQGMTPKYIPIWVPRSTSFYKSISPLLKAIKKNRSDKIVDRIFEELKRVDKDSEMVRKAEQLRRDILKNKGNIPT